LKNLETAGKNKAATHEREAQIQRAEKEGQGKPDDPQASYNLARLYTFYGEESSLTNGSPRLSSSVTGI
jgi:hypothetical protein